MRLPMIISALAFVFSTYGFAANGVELRFAERSLTNLEQCMLDGAKKALAKDDAQVFTGLLGRSSQNSKTALLSIYVGNDVEVTGYHMEFNSATDWQFVSYFGLRSPAMDPRVAVYFGNELAATVNAQPCLDRSLGNIVGPYSSESLEGRKF